MTVANPGAPLLGISNADKQSAINKFYGWNPSWIGGPMGEAAFAFQKMHPQAAPAPQYGPSTTYSDDYSYLDPNSPDYDPTKDTPDHPDYGDGGDDDTGGGVSSSQQDLGDVTNRIKQLQSGGNYSAVNDEGTQHGAYQMSDDRLNSLAEQYGAGTGIGSGDRYDPDSADTMGMLSTLQNNQVMSNSLGRDVSPHELYMGHVMGSDAASNVLGGHPDAKANIGNSGSSFDPRLHDENGNQRTNGDIANQFSSHYGGVF